MAKCKITQTRSSIGRKVDQGATLKALGLGRIGKEVVKEDTPSIRGMADKVSHLVQVEDVK